MKSIAFGVMISIIVGMIVVPLYNTILVGIILVILGCFLVPIIPISMNFASELTFPIAPAATNGLLLMFGQGSGALLGIVGTLMCVANPEYLMALYASFGAISLGLCFFIKEDLKKLAYTKKQQEAQ